MNTIKYLHGLLIKDLLIEQLNGNLRKINVKIRNLSKKLEISPVIDDVFENEIKLILKS
ncbi:MAG: hypothetical protein ACK5HR_00690 [Mycoplasmatales bacterium]